MPHARGLPALILSLQQHPATRTCQRGQLIAMNQEQFESLVARLERESARNPLFYKLRLGALAVLGYAYIAVVLLVLLALLAGFVLLGVRGGLLILVFKKVGLVLMALIGIVARSMWVQFEAPAGRRIERAEAPALFAFIDEIRRQLRAPRAHQVLITNSFNAAVMQLPRLGIFGWQKNYLLLGLPLMQGLTVGEFKAVLAHEFGHLCGAHGRFGAWIYRLRAGWSRLSQALIGDEHWGSFLFVPFFRWFGPMFAGYSFVQARQQEYEADRMSAEAAGRETAAAALIRVNEQGEFLDSRYWREIFRRADIDPHPLARPFTSMRNVLVQVREAADAAGFLDAAIQRRTGYSDTHPSLGDRLKALGLEPRLPQPLGISAAEEILGSKAHSLAAEFDEEWQKGVTRWWQDRHQYVTDSQRKIADYGTQSGQSMLSVEDSWHYAQLTEEFVSEDTALQMYLAVLNREPNHAAANFALGRLLLARNHESGVAHLEVACKHDLSAMQPACELIVAYFNRHGRQAEARPYIDKYFQAGDAERDARRERGYVALTDTFIPHQLEALALSELTGRLAKFNLRCAYLVRKETTHHRDEPLFVLGIQRQTNWWRLESAGAAQALVNQVGRDVNFPGETLIVSLDGEYKSLRGKFRDVPGSLLLPGHP
jgi:Zn-dependent protease with chaperone function